MKARVTVTLKSGVLDPQGLAISGSLKSLGFEGINSVRQGKVFDIDMAETDPVTARAFLTSMCERLLTNTVIENYAIEVMGSAPISSVWPSTQVAAAAPAAAAGTPATVAPAPAEPEAMDAEQINSEPEAEEIAPPVLDDAPASLVDALDDELAEPQPAENGDAAVELAGGAMAGDGDASFTDNAAAETREPEAEAAWPTAGEGVAFDIAAIVADLTKPAPDPSSMDLEPISTPDDDVGEAEKPQSDANDAR